MTDDAPSTYDITRAMAAIDPAQPLAAGTNQAPGPLPPDRVIRGLLESLEGRAGPSFRAAGAALMSGANMRLARVVAGISVGQWDRTRKTRPDVWETLAECEEIGMAVIDYELQRRALAGAEDRGSIRALEIIAKSRRAEYRDRQSQTVDVVHHVEQRAASLLAGWQNPPPADSQLP